MSVTFRTLTENDFDALHEAFVEAFSDYRIALQTSREDFALRLQRIHADFKLSAGAFSGGKMVGFIMHAPGYFRGVSTIYNGGTGVIPGFRGQRLTEKMYDFIAPSFAGFRQSLLEVITDNYKALAVYEKTGFERTREFNCYALADQKIELKSKKADLHIIAAPQWQVYQTFVDTAPSWQNRNEAVMNNLEKEVVFEARRDGKCVGFLSVDSTNGRISQIAVAHKARNQGIGRQLVQAAQQAVGNKPLVVINAETGSGLCGFFEKLGFQLTVRLYEMVKVC